MDGLVHQAPTVATRRPSWPARSGSR